MTAGSLMSQRVLLGCLGEILTYQTRTLSDNLRGMTNGETLTEQKIRIWQMEAGMG